ncbi:MAG TPA: glycosyltransferase family 4 protein [Tepidiformaceae bacterium]|nr:glycosyltransferase family 4 protein [Tepidiformaceae bacterium]
MGHLLVAGALPGDAAGLSVLTATLLDALEPSRDVSLLTHHISIVPNVRINGNCARPVVSLGVQPLMVHGEAILAARLHRRRIRPFAFGWAVGSRYAEYLRLAGLPYLIWEATTLRDEIEHTKIGDVRSAGRGTGIGTMLHKATLSLDERLEHRLYSRAKAVLAISDYTADRIRQLHGFRRDKVRVLRPPPTSSFLQLLEDARRASVRPQPRDDASRSLELLFVGRVDDPRKNFALLRDALRQLRMDQVAVRLTVVGPYNDEWLRSLGLGTDDAIAFLGRVSQSALTIQLLRHHALVVSSRQEGFGIVVSEAMHAGLPVIATRCGGPEHVLRESGAGILVDHTARALAVAIREIAEHESLRQRMGQLGRAYAERELSRRKFQQSVSEELELLRTSSAQKQ